MTKNQEMDLNNAHCSQSCEYSARTFKDLSCEEILKVMKSGNADKQRKTMEYFRHNSMEEIYCGPEFEHSLTASNLELIDLGLFTAIESIHFGPFKRNSDSADYTPRLIEVMKNNSLFHNLKKVKFEYCGEETAIEIIENILSATVTSSPNLKEIALLGVSTLEHLDLNYNLQRLQDRLESFQMWNFDGEFPLLYQFEKMQHYNYDEPSCRILSEIDWYGPLMKMIPHQTLVEIISSATDSFLTTVRSNSSTGIKKD